VHPEHAKTMPKPSTFSVRAEGLGAMSGISRSSSNFESSPKTFETIICERFGRNLQTETRASFFSGLHFSIGNPYVNSGILKKR